MPLYEYLCDACGRKIELIQSFSEPPLTICDRCGGTVKRLLSAPAVQFKGSGWYVSDYGRSGSAGTERKEGKEKESGSSENSSSKSSEKSSGSSGSSSDASGSSGSSGEKK